MTAYEIYIFILCTIVLLLLVLTFGYAIASMVKMQLNIIKHGLADGEITAKRRNAKTSRSDVAVLKNKITPCVVFVLVATAFVFSLSLNLSEKNANGVFPFKVVNSGSMAEKNKNNAYLFENNLDGQLKVFDLVYIQALPDESELKLYDVVTYYKDGLLIIHRIVRIFEPDEKHPARRYLMQGDANAYADETPITYNDMRGVYGNFRIPFVGSAIQFLHSPAGYLCVLLILFVDVVAPILDKKLAKAEEERLIAAKKSESVKRACRMTKNIFVKSEIAAYAKDKYGDGVSVTERKDFTKSGLPVADSYRAEKNGKAECFALVYADKSGGVKIKVKAEEDTAKRLEKEGLFVKACAVPRAKNGRWYEAFVSSANGDCAVLLESALDAGYNFVNSREGGEV